MQSVDIVQVVTKVTTTFATVFQLIDGNQIHIHLIWVTPECSRHLLFILAFAELVGCKSLRDYPFNH